MDQAVQCIDDNTLAVLLEGGLDEVRLARIEAHIDSCDACRGLVADLADRTYTRQVAVQGTLVLGDATQVDVHPESLGWLQRLSRSDTHYVEGQTIDHYEVIRELGQGGMGEVYLARDSQLGRRVALKVVSRRHLEEGGDPDRALTSFMREARATARLSHPNIVTIHAVGEHEGRPYLALEYIKGKSLKRYIREEPERPLRESLRITLAIANALAAAHQQGVLHRDLKPDNVLLSQDGRVRVVDFGLAETVEHEMADTTRRENGPLGPTVTGIAGTPMYMAPEQWEDEDRSGATDVWALGLILYELTSGAHPYRDMRTMTDLALAITSHDPVAELRIEGDAEMEAQLQPLVASMLSKDPKLRPEAQFVAGVLRSHHDRLGIVVTHAPSRSTAMIWGGVGVAAVVAGGALAFTLFREQPALVSEPIRAASAMVAGSAAPPAAAPAPTKSTEPTGPASAPPPSRRDVPRPPPVTPPPPEPEPAPEPEPPAPKDPLDVF